MKFTHHPSGLSSMAYMGGSVRVPRDVADEIEARRLAPDIYQIRVVTAGEGRPEAFGRIEWLGGGVVIPYDVAIELRDMVGAAR